MTDLRQRFEQWIDEAAHPEFSAVNLHKLAGEIEANPLLSDAGREQLLNRIRLKFSQRNAATFTATPCGRWIKEAA